MRPKVVMMASAAPIVEGAGKTAVDVGRVFGQGGTDGLILYALVLSTSFLFIVLVIVIWVHSRERTKAHSDCTAQAQDFAQAAAAQAEASKEVATAVASSASANMTFQQLMASRLDALERRIGEKS